MALFAPMPRASESAAIAVNPGLRRSRRKAWRICCSIVFSTHSRLGSFPKMQVYAPWETRRNLPSEKDDQACGDLLLCHCPFFAVNVPRVQRPLTGV